MSPEKDETSPQYVAGEILIKFRDGVITSDKVSKNINRESFTIGDIQEDEQTKEFVNHLNHLSATKVEKVFRSENKGLVKGGGYKLESIFKITVPEEVNIEQAIFLLSFNPYIEYVEPNYLAELLLLPDDPYYLDHYPDNVDYRDPRWNPQYDYQWNLKKINMEPAWDINPLFSPVISAVIDSGVDYTHPELGSCTLIQVQSNNCPKILPGYDFYNNDDDPIDDNGHGTHVSGIITALTNNSIGVAGIDFSTRIFPIKAFSSSGNGNVYTISEAIYYAVNNGANLINMSFGGSGDFPRVLSDALDYANQNGVVLIAAAGNSNINVKLFWPASYAPALTIAATDHNDTKAYFSNYGNLIDVAAPGTEVVSLRARGTDMYGDGSRLIGTEYIRASGTSMSAPHVSALAASILGQSNTYTPAQVRNVIVNSADKIEGIYFSDYTGYGRMNFYASMTELNISEPLSGRITVPTDGIYSNNVQAEIRGDAYGYDFDHYFLEWKKEGADLWSNFNIILSGLPPGDEEVRDGLLGTLSFDDSFTDGRYFLRLTVQNNQNSILTTENVFYIDTKVKAGWPVNLGGEYRAGSNSTPAVGDVDPISPGPEIVSVVNLLDTQDRSKVYVLSKDGDVLHSWEVSGRYPLQALFHPSPVLADIDISYPGLEIILPWWDKVYAWHSDGTSINGSWPISLGEVTITAASVADIDLDGSFEIMVSSPHRVSVFEVNGQMAEGWPKDYPEQAVETYIATPTVGDVDPNYRGLEIAYGADAKVHVFHYDGTYMDNWPKNLTYSSSVSSPIVIVDINPSNNDGLEVLTTSYNYFDFSGTLYIWNKEGDNYNSAWPKLIQNNPFLADLSVSDVDVNFSELEVATISVLGGFAYVYHSDGSSLPGWPIDILTYGISTPLIGDYYSNIQGNEIVFTRRSTYDLLPPNSVGFPDFDFLIYSNTGIKLYELPAPLISGVYASPVGSYFDNKNTITILTQTGSLIVLEFDAPFQDQRYEWAQFLHDEMHSGSMYSPCAIVSSKIQNAYGTTCGDALYDKVADLNKDRYVNILDFSILSSNQNPVQCQAYLDDQTDPCAVPTPIEVPGDANGDGVVDSSDFDIWLSFYKQTTMNGPSEGDFDLNEIVDGYDFNIWRNNFGTGIPTPTPVENYPVNLTSTFDGAFTIQYEWSPPADSSSSLYIWNGACRSGTYGPGDLLWSQPTNINTSYTYTNFNFNSGDTICAQIWKDFQANEVQSNESSVTKAYATPTSAPVNTPTSAPAPTPTSAPIPTPTPTQAPISCTVNLSPSLINVAVKSNTLVIADVSVSGPGTVSGVNFSTADSRFAYFSPTTDYSYPYQSAIYGKRASVTEAYASVYLNNSSTPNCSTSATVSVYK